MAVPTDRYEFRDYCLRKLGHPVIQVNVSDDQIDDRIDEAISFWNDFHYNGSELVYMKHELTEDDLDQGYIELPDETIGVTRIFDLASSIGTGTGMWNVTYQYVLNNLPNMLNTGLVDYYMTMSHIQFMQELLVGKPLIRYNRHSNRLYVDVDQQALSPGQFLVIEGHVGISQDDSQKMWSDRWLQNYAACLIKEAWGSNLTKFTGMQLVGGIQFNGEQILNDARDERRRMEDEAVQGLQSPVYGFMG